RDVPLRGPETMGLGRTEGNVMYAEIADVVRMSGLQVKIDALTNARGEITAYAMVTKRLKPFVVNGKSTEVIGVIWHFGFNGVASGEPANRLTPHVGDGNTMIPEYKAWLCDIRRA
ncbi:MAG: hypothetical protein QHH02_05700, partial [Syntrophomonadaceae bacterium]|nr:hypothetical protein [Syntrophomonadaceae bacterium]